MSLAVRRKWFQFSLRSFLIVVLIIAAALGWVVKRSVQARNENPFAKHLENLGGIAVYDYELGDNGTGFIAHFSIHRDAPGPRWLRSLLGETFFTDLVGFDGIALSDDDLADLCQFRKLKTVGFYQNKKVTDQGLAYLEQISTLRSIDLRGTGVSQDGIKRLQAALPEAGIAY